LYIGVFVGARRDLGPSLGVDQRLQMVALGDRFGLGFAGDHEGGQAEPQRPAVARTGT
jgi:hypothetical protein